MCNYSLLIKKWPWADYIFIITVLASEASWQQWAENVDATHCWAAWDNFTIVLVSLTFSSLGDKWPSSSFFLPFFSHSLRPSFDLITAVLSNTCKVTGVYCLTLACTHSVSPVLQWRNASLDISVDHDKVFTCTLPAWYLQRFAPFTCSHVPLKG